MSVQVPGWVRSWRPPAVVRPPAFLVRLQPLATRLRARTDAALTRGRPLITRARGWLSVITPLGAAVILAGVAALLAARRLGWIELAAAGLLALLLALFSFVWTLGRSSFEILVDLPGRRIRLGEHAIGRLVTRNTGHRASWPVQLELPVGAAIAPFPVGSLPVGAEHEELFSIPGRRRAVVVLGPVRSVRGDPIGLMLREQRWTEPLEIYIHPRTVPLHSAAIGFLRDIEGVTTQELSSNDVAFHALRDYVPGDDIRNVHWRSTARTGRLLVRQFEETRRAHLLLVLSVGADDYTDPDEFETAVSCAASLACQAIKADHRVSLLTQHGALRFTDAGTLLDQLAGVDLVSMTDAGAQVPSFRALAASAAAAVPEASVVSLLCGAGVEASELRGAGRALPLGALAFALRCQMSTALARRNLGDLLVFSLADVADLPLALRTVR